MTDIAKKAQEEILLDVSDEALEIVASAAKLRARVRARACLNAQAD
jgi:hypothetical protein